MFGETLLLGVSCNQNYHSADNKCAVIPASRYEYTAFKCWDTLRTRELRMRSREFFHMVEVSATGGVRTRDGFLLLKTRCQP